MTPDAFDLLQRSDEQRASKEHADSTIPANWSIIPLLILVLLFLEIPAMAQRIMHRIRSDETLATISTAYYGTPTYSSIISMANGIDPTSTLRVGEYLRIPTACFYTPPKVTSLENLAKLFLGQRKRWYSLSLINKLGRKKKVPAGKTLLIPFSLTHMVIPGDTYSDLAKRYYGNARQANLILSYNPGLGPKLIPGKQVEVPIAHIRVTSSRLEELINERIFGLYSHTEQEEHDALQEANNLLRSGHYWQVPLELLQFLTREHASDTLMAEVFKLLGTTYVALGQTELAVKAFEKALLRLPSFSLDRVTTSPKVIKALADAKTKMKKGTP